MPNFIIRWSEITILTAIVDAKDRTEAGNIVKNGVTPVHTTPVSRNFKELYSVRPCVVLPQLKSKENAASPTACCSNGISFATGKECVKHKSKGGQD